MGVSYEIGCKQCKVCITVAHKSYLLPYDEMNTLEFLKDHKGHDLIFAGDDEGTLDESNNIDEQYETTKGH